MLFSSMLPPEESREVGYPKAHRRWQLVSEQDPGTCLQEYAQCLSPLEDAPPGYVVNTAAEMTQTLF